MTTIGRHRFGWIEPHAARLVYCGEIPIGQTVTPTHTPLCPNCRKRVEWPASGKRRIGPR